MYPNLRAELGRKNMTIMDLSNKTEIPYSTLYGKIHGKTEITVNEAKSIKDVLECEMPIDKLFEKEKVLG